MPVMDGVAPPGWEDTVQELKRHGDIDNPWALAWWMHNEGYEAGMARDPDTCKDAWQRYQQARARGTLLGEVELAAAGVGWAQAALLSVKLGQGLRVYREGV